MTDERLGLEELRELVNGASREVGRLTGRVEQLEADLESARAHADRAERELRKASRKKKRFRELVWSAAESAFDKAAWLPVAFPVVGVGVAIVMCATDREEPPGPFHFEATGSVVAAPEAARLGARCAFTMDRAGPERCSAVITCGSAPLFEREVECALESREETSGDDTTYWRAVVVDAAGGDGSTIAMDSDRASVRVVTGSGAPVTIALHELDWDGEL